MMESGEIKKYYRWNSGFRRGQVECYLTENIDSVFFESGKTVPKSEFESLLDRISEDEYFQLSEQAQTRRTIEESFQSMMIESPEPSPSPTLPTHSHVIESPKEKNPIQIILERQKKIEKRKISFTFEIDAPPTKVIDLLTTMFDEEEVFNEIVENSLKLTNEELRSMIRENIVNNFREGYLSIKENE